MRTAAIFTLIVVALALVACTEQSLPQFADPEPITVPARQPALGPRLSQGPDEAVVLSWMEPGDKTTTLSFSSYHLGKWSAPRTAVDDSTMFVNWADLPAVTPTGPHSFLAHWLSYIADETYSYQVLTAQSDDRGASWSNPIAPHTDGTLAEHGFVSLHPASSGTGLIWLDGRNFPEGGMTLRGATLAADGSLSDEALLDDLVCDCCQTDVAEAASGPVAIYRNRTDDEVRDIYVSRNLDGLWQPGNPVSNDGWTIEGCPVNGPAIAASGKLVVAAWFTAANDRPTVKAAVSKNAGRSFSEPVVIPSKNALGHVGVSVIDRHSYAVSWMEKDNKGTYSVNIRGVTLDGQLGRVHTAGRTSLFRTVPQMARIGDKLVLAWTDEMNDLSKVVSVRVAIRGFYD